MEVNNYNDSDSSLDPEVNKTIENDIISPTLVQGSPNELFINSEFSNLEWTEISTQNLLSHLTWIDPTFNVENNNKNVTLYSNLETNGNDTNAILEKLTNYSRLIFKISNIRWKKTNLQSRKHRLTSRRC